VLSCYTETLYIRPHYVLQLELKLNWLCLFSSSFLWENIDKRSTLRTAFICVYADSVDVICRPAHWGPFVHQLQRLAANSTVLRSLKQVTPDSLLPLNFNSAPGIKGLSSEWKSTPKLELSAVVAASCAVQSCKDNWSSLWLPIDLILEDAMDGNHVAEASAVEVLTGKHKFQWRSGYWTQR